MERIRRRLTRTSDDIRSGNAPVPRWLLRASNVAVPALLVAFVGVAMFGGPGEFDPERALQTAPPVAPTVPPDGPTGGPTDEPTDPGGGGQDLSPTVLTSVSGGQVDVPAVTVDLAVGGTLAAFTGNTGGIDGVGPAPDYTATHPDATAGTPTVRFVTDTTVGFVVPIDPDGRGPDDGVSVDATVVERDGRWLFSW